MYNLSDEQRIILGTVRKFMTEEVAPLSRMMDESQELRSDIIQKCADLGLFSLIVPEDYSGMGVDLSTYCLIIEEISKVDASVGVTVQCSGTGLRPIILAGDASIRSRILPNVVRDKSLFAFAITEPEAGSDAAAIATRAIATKDKYVLNGRKCFITNGGIGDYYLVFASTAPAKRIAGMSAFVIKADSAGLEIGKREDKMGLRASPTTDLIFEDMEVPVENRVGPENDGFKLLMRTLDATRPTIAAQALGIAEGALSYACEYAGKRKQFGKSIGQFQGVQFMLSDMATQVEAARALLYSCTKLYDQNHPNISPLSSMAKLYASDVAMKVTTDAVQILGGYGYMKDHPLERMMRDAKITQIYEGTNQIQRVVIAKSIEKRGYPFSDFKR